MTAPRVPAAQFTTYPPTIFQQNAVRFASTPDTYIDQERHAAVARVRPLIRERRTGYALYLMTRSVMRQARIAGLGDVEIACCSCGGRCGHGSAS